MGLFSCCKGRRYNESEDSSSYSEDDSERRFMEETIDYNAMLVHSYYSSDSDTPPMYYDEEEEIHGGVSNVLYKKEYVTSVYAYTSEQLGTGATGSIRTVINKKTGKQYAMKTINLLSLNQEQRERLHQEVYVLSRLHHPNIVKLYEVYETSNAIYLIMEKLKGGELYNRLVSSPKGKFSEEYTKGIIRQILNAISYLHEVKNVAHRDLKLANILFTDKTNDEIKIIDFGLSRFVDNSDYMHSFVGTRYYIAPEIFMKDLKTQGYGKSCDMWSIGHNPLSSQSNSTPLNQVEIKEIPFPKKYWGELSADAKSFVEGLLQIDPVHRFTVEEAQSHPWFNTLTVYKPTTISESILASMQEFQSYNHLKKAALTAVAYHLNDNELMKLSDAFEYFDCRNDGVITFEEV